MAACERGTSIALAKIDLGPSQFHVFDLLGCIANGPTTDAALEATPGEIRECLRFLKRHGEKVDPEKPFQVIANLKHGTTSMTVTLADCFLSEKDFALTAGDHGQSVYAFTATRVTEQAG